MPRHWIGLLGLIPIAIGLSRLFNPDSDSSQEDKEETDQPIKSPLASCLCLMGLVKMNGRASEVADN